VLSGFRKETKEDIPWIQVVSMPRQGKRRFLDWAARDAVVRDAIASCTPNAVVRVFNATFNASFPLPSEPTTCTWKDAAREVARRIVLAALGTFTVNRATGDSAMRAVAEMLKLHPDWSPSTIVSNVLVPAGVLAEPVAALYLFDEMTLLADKVPPSDAPPMSWSEP